MTKTNNICNAIKSSLIVAIVSSSTQIYAKDIKKYDIKSADIQYEETSHGKVMGMIEIQENTTSRLVFDDYGFKELNEAKGTSKETTFGKSKITKKHTLNYSNGIVGYNVRFGQKKIMRVENQTISLASNNKKGDESLLNKIGAKKIGKGKVAGYKCDIWVLKSIKQCIYKGIPLKVEAEIMGIKTTKIAKKARFNIKSKSIDFALPNYPIYNINTNNPQVQPKKINKNRLKALDKKANKNAKNRAKENATNQANMQKSIGAGMQGAQKAGFDPSSGKNMTPAQLEAMQQAMMKAMQGGMQSMMGAQNNMFKMQKQSMLNSAKMIPQARKCFKKANSADDANRCEDMIDSENPEHHSQWNNDIKSQLLKDMDNFESSIPCIKKAKNFDSINSCMMR